MNQIPPSRSSASRRNLIAANWKMHLVGDDVDQFLDRLAADLPAPPRDYDLLIAPTAVWLERMAERCADLGIRLAAQDVHTQRSGAHTGDLAAVQAADAGATWSLCGHSERRSDHHEDEATVAAKCVAAHAAGLGVVFCLGETLPEREQGQVREVLARQIEPLLAATRRGELDQDRLVVAYEPVWAIGTGRTSTPDMAQETHMLLRELIADRLGPEDANGLQILYGGSVKPANAADLIAAPDIDGFLIGGASLDPGSFLDIIHRCGL